MDLDALRNELMNLVKNKHRFYWAIKRTFDILFSAGVLLVFSPLYLLLALIIFLDDPHGSPIYTQTRIGRKGRTFKFYKFRSMVVNADQLKASLQAQNEKEGPAFKIKDDPRITRVGHFIRRTSIDELPQFWNVLKGDMTIVGPRPALPEEVAQYNRYHQLRQLITPGLTCYWQIQPNRDDISFDDWVALDIQYIRDRNFFLDLKLILLTVKAMFGSQGH
ncbi:MAG: sugar transferase [Oscillospiraceae bacterium]|nr:sugar transferase [Oscillospiraceae bacterium]